MDDSKYCLECGLKYIKGAAHDCFSTVLKMLKKTQRVLNKRMKDLEELRKNYQIINNRFCMIQSQFFEIYTKILGNEVLVPHFIQTFQMTPEDEEEWLKQRLSEIQNSTYR